MSLSRNRGHFRATCTREQGLAVASIGLARILSLTSLQVSCCLHKNKQGTDMKWSTTDGRHQKALRRLAVVLLALAAVAESVARRSAPVRCILLWLLCRAESRAREFAIKTGGGAAITFPSTGSPVFRSGDSGEAARLAHAFETLAAVFFALSRRVAQFPRIASGHDPASLLAYCRDLVQPGYRLGACQRWCPDTS
jgi:hypothetical protein